MTAVLGRLALSGAAALAMTTASAQPALAHNRLVGTEPVNGASLGALPARVSFTFAEPVQQAPYDAIAITGPHHTRWATTDLTVLGDTISATPRPLGPAGLYTITYRIVGADGHPTSGQIAITLTTPGNGRPMPAFMSDAPPASGPGSVPAWQGLAAVALLAMVGVAATLRKSQP